MNKDKRNRTIRILSLFSENRFSPETEQDIHKWLIGEEDEDLKREASFQYWNTIQPTPDKGESEAFNRIKQRIGLPHKSKLFSWRLPYIAAALASLFVLGVSLVFFSKNKNNSVDAITAYGEIRQVILPDGSEVRLQPGSKLTYPTEFKSDRRVVRLNGEALFSVTSNEQQPFIVETNVLEVHVVGTTFNLQAYSEDNRVTTTLYEGKVKVRTGQENLITLMPDEQLIYDRVTGKIAVRKLTSNNRHTEDELCFDDSSLSEILRAIERRFNIRVSTIPTDFKERYTVKFHEKDDVNAILAVLNEMVDEYSFQRQGDEIHLEKRLDNEKKKI